jgi:hypothetical protein
MENIINGLSGVFLGFLVSAFGFFAGPTIGGLLGGCIMLAGLVMVFLGVSLIAKAE